MDQDILREVMVSLTAQRKNLPEHADPLDKMYADNFHEQLDLLQKAGFDVSRFRIPESQIQSHPMTYATDDGEPIQYTRERYVSRSILLTKIDTVLGYFTLSDKQIGFRPPS